MLLLAAVITAFAGPYIPRKENVPKNVYVVTDNSPSLSYHEGQTSLKTSLLTAAQNLLNDQTMYKHWDGSRIRETSGKEIRQTFAHKNSPYVFDHEKILRKLARIPKAKKVLYFTDTQFLTANDLSTAATDTASQYLFVTTRPLFPVNTRPDTAYIRQNTLYAHILTEGKSFSGDVEIYAGPGLLYKRHVELPPGKTDTLQFAIPARMPFREGKIRLSGDPHALFDNTLYFTFPARQLYRIAVAGDSVPSFIEKIFPPDKSEVRLFKPDRMPWNELDNFDLVVLKGWKSHYPFDLMRQNKRTFFIFMPAFDRYDADFFRKFGWIATSADTTERSVLHIQFGHPFFKGAFTHPEKRFRPPRSAKNYILPSGKNALMRFAGGHPYLIKRDNWLIFTGAVEAPHSDFYLSPFVIPVFLKALENAPRHEKLYYILRPGWYAEVKAPLSESPLAIVGQGKKFIPYQETHGSEIRLFPSEFIDRPGIYYVVAGKDTVDVWAVNYDRRESKLHYADSLPSQTNIRFVNASRFRTEIAADQKKTLSRMFIALAFFFFLTEMMLLKYMK